MRQDAQCRWTGGSLHGTLTEHHHCTIIPSLAATGRIFFVTDVRFIICPRKRALSAHPLVRGFLTGEKV